MEPLTKFPTDLVLVGHITGAYGVNGWIRVHPYSSDAGALLHAKKWWLGQRTASPEPVADSALNDVEKLEAKLHGDDVVARIVGIVDRGAAEALKGQVVKIQRSHFPALSDNEFYWLDLIGLAVENLQGDDLGVVADLMDNGAHPILRVVKRLDEAAAAAEAGTAISPESGAVAGAKLNRKNSKQVQKTSSEREYLIPFVEHFVPEVDRKNRKITVDWGLDY